MSRGVIYTKRAGVKRVALTVEALILEQSFARLVRWSRRRHHLEEIELVDFVACTELRSDNGGEYSVQQCGFDVHLRDGSRSPWRRIEVVQGAFRRHPLIHRRHDSWWRPPRNPWRDLRGPLESLGVPTTQRSAWG